MPPPLPMRASPRHAPHIRDESLEWRILTWLDTLPSALLPTAAKASSHQPTSALRIPTSAMPLPKDDELQNEPGVSVGGAKRKREVLGRLDSASSHDKKRCTRQDASSTRIEDTQHSMRGASEDATSSAERLETRPTWESVYIMVGFCFFEADQPDQIEIQTEVLPLRSLIDGDQPSKDILDRFLDVYNSRNMHMFGVFHGDRGFTDVIEDDYDFEDACIRLHDSMDIRVSTMLEFLIVGAQEDRHQIPKALRLPSESQTIIDWGLYSKEASEGKGRPEQTEESHSLSLATAKQRRRRKPDASHQRHLKAPKFDIDAPDSVVFRG